MTNPQPSAEDQAAALDAALLANRSCTQTGQVFLAATTRVLASGGDRTELLVPLQNWRRAVGDVCQAVRGFVGECGPDGPSPSLLDGATPPRELWSTGVETLTATFPTELDAWEATFAAGVVGGIGGTEQGQDDPALPILDALARLQDFLTEKWMDRNVEATTEAFEQHQRAHGGTVSTRSEITPVGGKRTEIKLEFNRSDIDEKSPDRTIAPRWWTRFRQGFVASREWRRTTRPFINFGITLTRDESPLHRAVDAAIASWLPSAVDVESGYGHPWYGSFFVTEVINGLGFDAVHRSARIEITALNESPHRTFGWVLDGTDLPPALIWLPTTGEVVDLMSGNPFLEPGVGPSLFTDITAPEPGTTLTRQSDSRRTTYTIVDDIDRAGLHDLRCQAIEDFVATEILPNPALAKYRAA